MLRRFPFVRTFATVCILSLTVQIAAPVLSAPQMAMRGGGKSDNFNHFL
ncbi:MAG: hypothetical protein HPY54_15630 [Chthonomonadetes bacterium]|nr:hypothetical protein [Chthonomonadetes bacterium]